ncbi:MAG: beta-ketoacyl-ACP synthase II [Elusimicrobiota bacterium]|jgi:3-oxoacyl-[acyl-carrier-protein] synthase II
MKRVVITGIGCVTPLGIGSEALWQGICREKSAVRRITRFDTSALRSRIAASIEDFDPFKFMEAKIARRLDRFSQFAVACAGMALQEARLTVDQPDHAGTYVGSALGGIGHAEEEHTHLVQEGLQAVDRLIALSVFTGAGASNVSIAFGLNGPALSNANSCAAGTIAIGEAFRMIQAGQVEVMLAGGAEAPLAPLCFGAFDLIRAMSTRNDAPEQASRPFDRARDGFVMGEGAALFVLEELEHAVKRGGPIYAEILGYGVTSDAYRMTFPRPDGSQVARAIQLALKESRLEPSALDAINAHGSSTPINDKTETLALKIALGPAAREIPISATKAMHGHALGATGAMEVAISLLAMKHSHIPPTLNLENPDPECDLDYVPQKSRSKRLTHILTHSFGFGGSNAALVLRSSPISF